MEHDNPKVAKASRFGRRSTGQAIVSELLALRAKYDAGHLAGAARRDSEGVGEAYGGACGVMVDRAGPEVRMT
jgi:hypothetical protein